MRGSRARGAALGIVLLLSALAWALAIALLLAVTVHHTVARASLERASALAVADHLVEARRGAWEAYLSGGSDRPESEDGGDETCRWRIRVDDVAAERVRATVEVTLGRALVRVGATAHAESAPAESAPAESALATP